MSEELFDISFCRYFINPINSLTKDVSIITFSDIIVPKNTNVLKIDAIQDFNLSLSIINLVGDLSIRANIIAKTKGSVYLSVEKNK
ncbi:hypothetical protein CSC2_38680 [Clostridium zeae]|uniref:Uncharacterized protein n=1 Tax=Clostridium zeae TaxID=2759022 RepID=A0ABQ1EEZ3_9CLOT|nr:hypothetical protein CSC2_38680 [Clostridium zeae]